jgi:pimeloyl-ACP methyl ester carboxylesterase
MTHGRSPSRPDSPVGGGQAGPVPGSGRSWAREHACGNAAVGPAPVVPLSQVAGDTVGLMEALGFDRADVSGGSMGGMIAQQNDIG